FSKTCFGACAPKENGAKGHCIALKKVKFSFSRSICIFQPIGAQVKVDAQGWNGILSISRLMDAQVKVGAQEQNGYPRKHL
ncbi:MAG: hypothetical protein MJA29_14185, partial [Candidatus Omnitrophica bacterium]|nr:hypothetical protein [Candidatus Omnitrophota bacterium]